MLGNSKRLLLITYAPKGKVTKKPLTRSKKRVTYVLDSVYKQIEARPTNLAL